LPSTHSPLHGNHCGLLDSIFAGEMRGGLSGRRKPARLLQAPVKQYILVYKPYGMLSRFTPENTMPEGTRTLRALGPLPRDLYPVGRLDADSEGLLLLTNDREVAHRLSHPSFGHPKTYLVQVERIPDQQALERLRRGGIIIQGSPSLPARVRLLEEEPQLPPRGVPIRFRKSVPTAWIELTVRQGKNRLVRRLTSAVGHPTLRLVRTGLGPLRGDDLVPGQFRRLSGDEVRVLRQSLRLESAQRPFSG
jgi:23S rRNA pseudouridine2457 synthase